MTTTKATAKKRVWWPPEGVGMVLSLLWFGLVVLPGGSSLRVADVSVPREVELGESVTLQCRLVLGPETLYSLAWWKDGQQFMRAWPGSGHPKISIYKVPGVQVQANGGRGLGTVVLRDAQISTSGTYTCEGVADFPTFEKDALSANMTVVSEPDTHPIVWGYKPKYYPGEVLQTNCTCLRTYPQPRLLWYINGERVREGRRRVEERFEGDNGEWTVTVSVTLRLWPRHFLENGSLRLACESRVGRKFRDLTAVTLQNALPPKNPLKATRPATSTAASLRPKTYWWLFGGEEEDYEDERQKARQEAEREEGMLNDLNDIWPFPGGPSSSSSFSSASSSSSSSSSSSKSKQHLYPFYISAGERSTTVTNRVFQSVANSLLTALLLSRLS
ncbi:uncharacterized protein LOC143033291 [Oratosquilla oratoria]|uniref:uncharacterized protein LOC143033291 n=1 Tax=Oratosquilla oratoria TaxID=337810 RepID=UPI003F76883C